MLNRHKGFLGNTIPAAVAQMPSLDIAEGAVKAAFRLEGPVESPFASLQECALAKGEAILARSVCALGLSVRDGHVIR